MSVTLYVKDQPGTVMAQLYRLYKENILCDTTMVSRQGHVLCHSLVLSCIQPECLSQVSSAATLPQVWHQCVYLQAFSIDVVQVVVDFMYTGQIVIYPHTALDLVDAFQRFGLHLAVELCQRYLEMRPVEQGLIAPDFISKEQATAANRTAATSLRPHGPDFYDIRIRNGQLEGSTLSKMSDTDMIPISKPHWYADNSSGAFVKPHKRYAWEKWSCPASDDMRGHVNLPAESDSHRLGLESYGSALLASQNPDSLALSSHLSAITDPSWQDNYLGPDEAGHLIANADLYKRFDFPDVAVSSSQYNPGISCVDSVITSQCVSAISDAPSQSLPGLSMSRTHHSSVSLETSSSHHLRDEQFTGQLSHQPEVQTNHETTSGKHSKPNQFERGNSENFRLLNLSDTSKPSQLYDKHRIKKYLLHSVSGSSKFCNLIPVTSATTDASPSPERSTCSQNKKTSAWMTTDHVGPEDAAQPSATTRHQPDKLDSIPVMKPSQRVVPHGKLRKAQNVYSTLEPDNGEPGLGVNADPKWLCELCRATFHNRMDRDNHQQQCAQLAQCSRDRSNHQHYQQDLRGSSENTNHLLQSVSQAELTSDGTNLQVQSEQRTGHGSDRASQSTLSAQISQHAADKTIHKQVMQVANHGSERARYPIEAVQLPNHITDQADPRTLSIHERQHGTNTLLHGPQSAMTAAGANQQQSLQTAGHAPSRARYHQQPTHTVQHSSEKDTSPQPAVYDDDCINQTDVHHSQQLAQYGIEKDSHNEHRIEINEHDLTRSSHYQQSVEMTQVASAVTAVQQQTTELTQPVSENNNHDQQQAEMAPHAQGRSGHQEPDTKGGSAEVKPGKGCPMVPDCTDEQDVTKAKKPKKAAKPAEDAPPARDPSYPYSCTHCDSKFKRESEQLRHLRHKHGVPFPRDGRHTILRCEKEGCDFETLHSYTLRVHIKRHDSDKPYLCDSCGRDFKSSYGLKQHSSECAEHDDKQDKSIPCELCGTVFKDSNNLKSHMSKLHKGKQHRCPQCPYTSYSRSNLAAHTLAKHQLTLDNKQKLNCPYCEWATTSQSSLNSHIRRHTGESVVNCDVCGKGFPDKKSLTSHRKWHKTKRTCPCPYDGCKYVAAIQATLNRHIRVVHTHKDDKPYMCDICPYRTNIRGNLRAHLLSRHKIKVPAKHRLLQVRNGRPVDEDTNPKGQGAVEKSLGSNKKSGTRSAGDMPGHVEEPKQSDNISLLNLDTLATTTYVSNIDPVTVSAATEPPGSQRKTLLNANMGPQQQCPSTQEWAQFQYKDRLSRYRDSHYKDKTVSRPSYLYNGNSYTGKTTSLY